MNEGCFGSENMPGATARAFGEPLETLFGPGTCAGLSDGELLARFLSGRDEAGELAFETLVKRHGPMVRGVCRQALDDPVDIHDAWQAVFLVLARRADAIRKRESLGSWLHGVAVRAAARARVSAVRRRIRERRAADAARAQATLDPETSEVESTWIERQERDGLVHSEISRLPEKYRAPIVLCYMEGLTHDEAATSLRWPVGTVRSRLSRGRDALRRRLSRRGVAGPAVAGPLGAWLAGEQGTFAGATDTVTGALTAEMVKLVSQSAARHFTAAASSQMGSLALADGVLKMLMLKKISVAAAVILALATLTVGGGVALVRTSKAQDAKSKAARSDVSKAYLLEAPYRPAEPIDADRQKQEILRLAHSRFELRSRLHNAGEISLDHLIAACEELEKAESYAAKNSEERIAAKQRHLSRLKNVEARAETAVKAGQGSAADLQGIKIRRMEVELDLSTGEKNDANLRVILQRIQELEKKVEQLEKRVLRGLGGSL
jgi:RNA polymerase sigma factor (sigma-70 family)